MNPAPLARAVLVAAGLLAVAAVASARPEQPLLVVSGPRWVIAGGDVTVTVTTAGALAESRLPLVLTIGVDGVAVDRVEATGTRTRVAIDWRHLPPGRHEILAKTGSERARYEIEVLPRRPVWLAVGLVGLALGASLGLWRRHRRARKG